MASATLLDGSPSPRKQPTVGFSIYEDVPRDGISPSLGHVVGLWLDAGRNLAWSES